MLRSVGYTGIPIEGVPFDEKRGLILNEGGRVLDSHDSGHKVGHYTAGWIKRGPSGVIGTNKKDALETVQHLLADVESQTLLEPGEPGPRRGRGRCSPSAASATSASRTGRRSTRPRSAAASPTAAPGSSSSGSRRCSTRSARRSRLASRAETLDRAVADLAELKAMIEAALPGADGRGRVDETGAGDHLRATRRGAPSSRASRGSTSTAGQGRGQGSASTTARSTPCSRPPASSSTTDPHRSAERASYSVPMADPELKSKVEELIAANPVLLFMKGTPEMPRCGFSMRVVQVLDAIDVEYGAIDVLPALQPLREVTAEISDWQTFPQLYVNGELLGGADIVEEMFESGELAEALGVEQPEAAAAAGRERPPAQSPPLQIE